MPCLEGVYMVNYNNGKASKKGLHPWRAVNLVELDCSCRNWHDMQFPCIHSVQAAVRAGKPISDLFKWKLFTITAYEAAYKYQFVPTPTTATLAYDKTMKEPPVIAPEPLAGKRGLRPGPKPKHKRKNPKVGSAATPLVSMT